MAITDALRNAIALARANPGAMAELDAEEAAVRKAAEAEAKRLAGLEAKVRAAIPERARLLTRDFVAIYLSGDPKAAPPLAVQQAAEELADAQLRQTHGLEPWQAIATYGPAPAHLTPERVARCGARILKTRPISWDGQRTPEERQRATMAEIERSHPPRPHQSMTEEARRAAEAARPEAVAARAAAEQRRQQAIREQKRAVGIEVPE